ARAQIVLRAVRALPVADAAHAFPVVQEPGRLRVAQQRERGLVLGGVGYQVEEVPLRYQRDVLVRSGYPAEVTQLHAPRVELHLDAIDLPVGQRGEALAEAE